jgi:outer membrane protein assembly factor BamB
MKKNKLLIGLITLMVITSVSSYAQNWPQFRGPNRDSKVTGFKAPAKWPEKLAQQWKITVGTGDASPVLVGKNIYLHTRQGNEEVILCLDAATGREIWKNSYPANAVTGPSASHPGPRSTPAVSNGFIVTFGATGILSCLDANTGKVAWRKENPMNEVPQFFTGMSPLIIDGICIVHVGKKDDGKVLALDLKTGNEKWKWSGDGPAYASPSLMIIDGKKHIIVQTEKNLISLDFADGKLLWQVSTLPQQRFYNCVSPYIDGNKIYYSGQGTGTKAIEVSKQGTQFVTRELWSNTETGAKWNTAILKDGYLYGFTDQRRIYCLNASNGETAWVDNTTNSDFATILDCGSVIIGLPSTGNLIVFKPDPKAYSEIAKYKVSETAIYAFPIIAGNTIYVKDAESLIMYKTN